MHVMSVGKNCQFDLIDALKERKIIRLSVGVPVNFYSNKNVVEKKLPLFAIFLPLIFMSSSDEGARNLRSDKFQLFNNSFKQ